MKKQTTYDQYMVLVDTARRLGYGNDQIAAELRAEIQDIQQRCAVKCMALAGNRSPYPAREARRVATECIMVVERIIKELEGVTA